jgi:membrane fusion protein (multidrug efflux system)
MLKRMLWMLVAVAAVLGAIAFVKVRQIQGGIAQASAFRPPPEAVTTIVASRTLWAQNLEAIGTVSPDNGVMVCADLPGVVDAIAFDSGRQVAAGDVLVRLDTRQEQAQLAAAQARLDLARRNLDRARDLLAQGVIPQADFDAAKAANDQADASVGEIAATIGRKTIRAPFAGVLGIRQAQLGQYLAGGAPVVPLQALDPIHVDFGIPQQEIGRVRVGGPVRVTTDGPAGDSFDGTVTAIDAVVDPATRNFQVRATFRNPRRLLRTGMFVRAELPLPQKDAVIALPASSILYAPYGDSVFVVEKMKGPDGAEYLGVRQQVVTLGPSRGDQVAVLSGVEPGATVVTSGVFKLRSGAAVLVNNEVQPANDVAPAPAES